MHLRCASLAGDNGSQPGMILKDELRRKGLVEGRTSLDNFRVCNMDFRFWLLELMSRNVPINTRVGCETWVLKGSTADKGKQ